MRFEPVYLGGSKCAELIRRETHRWCGACVSKYHRWNHRWVQAQARESSRNRTIHIIHTVYPTILFSNPRTVSYGSSIDSDSWSNLNVRFQSSNKLLHLYGTKGRRDDGVESKYQHHLARKQHSLCSNVSHESRVTEISYAGIKRSISVLDPKNK